MEIKAKNLLLGCLAVIALMAFERPGNHGQSNPAAYPPPDTIRWDKTEHDFGNIKRKVIVDAFFTCYNGKDTLQIENVVTTCGCLAAGWYEEPVKPYDSTVIRVTFDSKGRSGKHTRRVGVYTNKGYFELVIKANIDD